MINDHLSDLLTRIRNAGMARLGRVDAFNTKLNKNVADILVREGYLKGYKEIAEGTQLTLRMYLRFEDGDLRKPVVQGLKRESKPGLRRYVNSSEIPRIKNGYGIAIISTSKGLFTDKDARKQKIGGELLCSVW